MNSGESDGKESGKLNGNLDYGAPRFCRKMYLDAQANFVCRSIIGRNWVIVWLLGVTRGACFCKHCT